MRFFAIAPVLFSAALGVFASPAVERQAPQSVAVVLSGLITTVTPLAEKLLYATYENATREILTPIIGDISSAVNATVDSLKSLVGQHTSVILASVDGTATLTASDIASLLATVVNLIFSSMNAVLPVVSAGNYSDIYTLLIALGKVVLALLPVVISLVSGLIGPLSTSLAPILGIVATLGLTALLSSILGGVL